MVKLNERKIRWIIQQKLGGRGTGEIALIQRVSRRRVEQLWQAYRLAGVLPALKKAGRPRNVTISLAYETPHSSFPFSKIAHENCGLADPFQ